MISMTNQHKAPVKHPTADMRAFKDAVEQQDRTAIQRIKTIYQMVGGSIEHTLEEIQWHINQRLVRAAEASL